MIGNMRGFIKGNKPWNYGRIINLVCKECKKEFSVIKARENKAKFCSKKCKSLWMSKNLIGKNSPSWRGGFTPVYKYARNWLIARDWRKKVYERDDYTCQECGQRGVRLEVHHIKSFTHYPDIRWDINNGLTLCYKCHQLTKKGCNTIYA